MSVMEKLWLDLSKEEISILSVIIQENSQFLSEYKKLRSETVKKCYQIKLLHMIEVTLAKHFNDFELISHINEIIKQHIEHIIETIKGCRQNLTNFLEEYDKFLEETRGKIDDENEILEDTRSLNHFNSVIARSIEICERRFKEASELKNCYCARIKRLHISESRAELLLWSLEDLMKEIPSKPSESEVD